MKTGNTISDAWNMFSNTTLFRSGYVTAESVKFTIKDIASPPVTVLAGPWFFFAVLSSLNSCVWFHASDIVLPVFILR